MVNGSRLDTAPGMDPRITHALSRMETAVDGAATLAQLAAGAKLSASRFAYLFRRDTGMPPARYLHQLRMDRARLLLERTSLTVKEVMAFVGVHDPSHFSRDFSRHHGVAPGRLRERSWAADRGRRPNWSTNTDDGQRTAAPRRGGDR